QQKHFPEEKGEEKEEDDDAGEEKRNSRHHQIDERLAIVTRKSAGVVSEALNDIVNGNGFVNDCET
ncbi:hypothetical protein PIB30_089572, partial [Stylosanthes scabra]|nr:hypothetical protein [Stylosanthes scabra]